MFLGRGAQQLVHSRILAYLPVALWLAVYPALLLLDFFTLRTNAFDLSVFDYALWTAHEGPVAGFVPFFGHTLQAQHFMPTLFLLTPLHFLWPSPVLLVVLQCAAVAVAGILLARIALEHVPPLAASAIVLAFLASRKAHSAVISTFYIESFEPALMLGFVWAASARRWAWYWPLVGLALGCKEDVAIYVALFGVLLTVDRRTRLQGALTVPGRYGVAGGRGGRRNSRALARPPACRRPTRSSRPAMARARAPSASGLPRRERSPSWRVCWRRRRCCAWSPLAISWSRFPASC